MLKYLKKNIRHAVNGARTWSNCQSIGLFAQRWRNTMKVPEAGAGFMAALADGNSLIGRLFALNGSAVPDADSIIDGQMRILNRTIDFGGDFPDWHRDCFSGIAFPIVPYPQIDGAAAPGADIVPVWELSRMQFVPCLVQAYRQTRDARYAEHFYRLLAHWDTKNPYLMGANWACGLDIAIRALHIALGWSSLPSADTAWVQRLLWLHVYYLQKRDLFEARSTVNNHYLVTLALQYVLLHCFESNEVETWKGDVLRELDAEIRHQFRPDGGNIESAMQYHQFSLEALLLTAILGSPRADVAVISICPQLSAEANQRIYAAMRFAAQCCATWGSSPRIGDSSDARVIIHRDYFTWHPTDAGYLADWGRLLYGPSDLFVKDTSETTVVFTDSGVGLLRSERYSLIALAMPVAAEAGGHNHYDKGSFLLRTPEREIFIDSGTYCYTHDPEARRAFRQGRAHNVVLLDSLEQAVGPGGGVFDVPRFGQVLLQAMFTANGAPAFHVVHDGYRGRENLGLVERQIVCMPEELLITDTIDGLGKHTVEVIFNLAPGLVVESRNNRLLIGIDGNACIELVPSPGFVATIEMTCSSKAYMESEANERIVLRRLCDAPCVILTHVRLGIG